MQSRAEAVQLGRIGAQRQGHVVGVITGVRAALGSSGQEGTPYGDGQTAPSIAALLTGSPR